MELTAEERLKWWHAVRFGMFIHWGLYASLAGSWKGQKTPGIGEWIMRDVKIPVDAYEQLAKDFNPVKFDAEAWAEVAKQAGMKYLVITAKHHDGFCMFDSPSNPYNIVNKTPFKRDPMKELAEACRKRDIKMCFYYSQALDWHAEGGAGHWDEIGSGEEWLSYARPPEDFQAYLHNVVKPNLRELLTNYGPIGLIWFDTPVMINKEQSEDLRDFVHSLQPECLVSGRVGHDVGDYGSLGDNEHPAGRVEGAWETPATLNDTWGFKSDDENWKSLAYLLELLVNCASKGVNYLLNVGPTDEGVIPQPSVDLLKQVGAWVDRNGEAIYGTEASPFLVDPAWGRVTCKGNTLYLLIKKWPAADLNLCGLRNVVQSVRVLGNPEAKVAVNRAGDTLSFSLPAEAPEEIVSVVEVVLDGVPDVESIIIQDGASAIDLPTHLADVDGDIGIRKDGTTEGWTDTNTRVSWRFRVTTPGTYNVVVTRKLNRNLLSLFGTPVLKVSVGDTNITAPAGVENLDTSEGAKVIQHIRNVLGEVAINAAGECTLSIAAETLDPEAERGLTLMAVELAPVA